MPYWGGDRNNVERIGAQGVDGINLGGLIEGMYENAGVRINNVFNKIMGKLKTGQMNAGRLLGAPVFERGVCRVKNVVDNINGMDDVQKVEGLRVVGLEGKGKEGVYWSQVVRCKVREVLNMYSPPKDEGGRRVVMSGIEPYFNSLKDEGWEDEDRVLVMKLFGVNDRAVRGSMLGRIDKVTGGGKVVVNKGEGGGAQDGCWSLSDSSLSPQHYN